MQGFFRIPARLHSGCILMTELAQVSDSDTRLSLRQIGEHMQVSDGYLEEIAATLKAAGLIDGRTGPKGGYRLARKPEDISMEEIVRAIEGPVALVSCHDGAACPVQELCHSKCLWDFLQRTVMDSLREKKLSDCIADIGKT